MQNRYTTDRFGDTWCDYYKSVSWNLPEAGAFVMAFVTGLLQLTIPIASVPSHGGGGGGGGRDAVVFVYGVAVREGAGNVTLSLPTWATARWPLAFDAVEAMGLNVKGVACNLACQVGDADATPSRLPTTLVCSLTQAAQASNSS
jgi:hypothetical protein